MARTDYNVTIEEMSRNFANATKKEQIALKDMNDCIRIDQYADEGLVLKVTGYAMLLVHNEHARENTDYSVFKLFADDGQCYITSSESLYNQFMDFWDEINDGAQEDEPLDIKVFAKDSKNFTGKKFFTCRLI